MVLLSSIFGRKRKKEKSPNLSPDHYRQLGEQRYMFIKELLELVYYTCDNFQSYKDKITDFISKSYTGGNLHHLYNDIVEVTDLCENGAMSSLAAKYSLTPTETRTCCFIYWGFKWQQTCTAEAITGNAYNVRCSRIRKKLGLGGNENLRVFIRQYCNSLSNSSGQ